MLCLRWWMGGGLNVNGGVNGHDVGLGPCWGMRTPRQGLLGGPGPTHPDGRQEGEHVWGEGPEVSLEGCPGVTELRGSVSEPGGSGGQGGEGALVRREKGSEGSCQVDVRAERKRDGRAGKPRVSSNWEGGASSSLGVKETPKKDPLGGTTCC